MIYLKELSCKDGEAIYEMLKGIGENENSFTNPVYQMDYTSFKEWLNQQSQWSKGENLPKGFVGQTIYWLFDDNTPVGIGKIRHSLTNNSRQSGGNIGYAISSRFRGKGYGTELLRLLIQEAKQRNMRELVLTVNIGNKASRKIIEKNGGILINENSDRWYFRIMEE